MLVLTRRTGDSIVIDGRIVVTVLDVRGEVVRVGVDAPREIQIHRAEIYRALQEANQAAAADSGDDAAAALQALVARRGRRTGDSRPPGPGARG
ncbi:MAG: carbon storage regulator CsrA [Kineosporiaceae bacterium]